MGFDSQKEVLHCDKPGTGLADAPRAFQVKLVGILTQKCGMRQSGVDNELCFRHDPLKITGERSVVHELLKVLEREFGELTIQRGTYPFQRPAAAIRPKLPRQHLRLRGRRQEAALLQHWLEVVEARRLRPLWQVVEKV